MTGLANAPNKPARSELADEPGLAARTKSVRAQLLEFRKEIPDARAQE